MWVQDLVKDKTFADVGGLWNTINEKVTVASLAGAHEVTMIDLMHNKSHWWDKFDEKCKNEDVVCNNKVSAFFSALKTGASPFSSLYIPIPKSILEALLSLSNSLNISLVASSAGV